MIANNTEYKVTLKTSVFVVFILELGTMMDVGK
jgi:hypothetical protein